MTRWQEDGLENFIFQVVEECPKEKLNDRKNILLITTIVVTMDIIELAVALDYKS